MNLTAFQENSITDYFYLKLLAASLWVLFKILLLKLVLASQRVLDLTTKSYYSHLIGRTPRLRISDTAIAHIAVSATRALNAEHAMCSEYEGESSDCVGRHWDEFLFYAQSATSCPPCASFACAWWQLRTNHRTSHSTYTWNLSWSSWLFAYACVYDHSLVWLIPSVSYQLSHHETSQEGYSTRVLLNHAIQLSPAILADS